MNPKQNLSASRATELWQRFVGMFGGDAVARKFGDEPTPEWIAGVSLLKDFELDRGIRRLLFSGKQHVPALPEFVKLCRTIGGDDFDDGPKVVALPGNDGFKGDEWTIAANNHLFAHILRACINRRAFSPTETQILVGFKNAWARDMREGNVDPATGEVCRPSLESQQGAWADCIQRAEEAIAQKAAA